MSSRAYEASVEALAYEPEPLELNKGTIMREAYESLCELVEAQEITLEEANILYNHWTETYGL
jgi:hypothetical protein